jgi:hypothetical protein
MESMKHSRDASPRGDFQNDKRAAIFRIYNYKSVKIDFDFRMRDASVLIYLLKTSPRPPETKVLRPEKNTFSLTS